MLKPAPQLMTTRNKAIWTLGNFLMLLGLYLLLLVGGLLADERYNLLAAQGDSDIPLPSANAPVVNVAAGTVVEAGTSTATPRPTGAGGAGTSGSAREEFEELRPAWRLQLNNPGNGVELSSLPPQQLSPLTFGPSTITRIQVPIKVNGKLQETVDRKVQEVGLHIEQQNGTAVAIWDVVKYGVGHHQNTSNPGQGGNIVLAGHSGGKDYPFNNLYYMRPGDDFHLWSNGRVYSYVVTETLVLDEIGPDVSEAQRRANARYIEPTSTEMVTLVTCWPLSDTPERKKFSQRVVVRALPASNIVADAPTNTPEPPTATATNTPEPTPTFTPMPTPTNTPEPTATNTPEPTPTNTPEPTATPTEVASCIPLAGLLTTADPQGTTNLPRYDSLDDVYLVDSPQDTTGLVGQTLYFQVVTPNGATKLTTVGQYRVTQPTIRIRLLDYVQVLAPNPNPQDAYKLLVSTDPAFPQALCTTSTNFRVAAPTTATPLPTVVPTTAPTATAVPTTAPAPTAVPTATIAPTVVPTNTVAPTQRPTNTVAPTQRPTNTAVPTTRPTTPPAPTPQPTTAAPPAPICIPLLNYVATADENGDPTVFRYDSLDDVYVLGAPYPELAGKKLYFQVTTPNGATKITTFGEYTTDGERFLFKLTDYVRQFAPNPNPQDALKLRISTDPGFPADCTTGVNFQIRAP